MKLIPICLLFKELDEIIEFHPLILLIRKLKFRRYKGLLSWTQSFKASCFIYFRMQYMFSCI